jgi:hypothetical protein
MCKQRYLFSTLTVLFAISLFLDTYISMPYTSMYTYINTLRTYVHVQTNRLMEMSIDFIFSFSQAVGVHAYMYTCIMHLKHVHVSYAK